MSDSDFLFGKTKCPTLYKSLDDISREVNTKLKMRGIGKGFVCVQFATYNLMWDFIKALPKEIWEYVCFDKENLKFKENENYGNLRNKDSLPRFQLFSAC